MIIAISSKSTDFKVQISAVNTVNTISLFKDDFHDFMNFILKNNSWSFKHAFFVIKTIVNLISCQLK